MIFARRRPCADHRSELLAFVDGQPPSDATPRALAHLDQCRTCERELSEIALTIAALRRLHGEIAAIEPSADAWPRLRARIERPPRRRPPIMSPLAGMAMGFAIVAAVVGFSPGMLPVGPDRGAAEDPISRAARVQVNTSLAEEEMLLRTRLQNARRPAAPQRVERRPIASAARIGPDGIERSADRPGNGRRNVSA